MPKINFTEESIGVEYLDGKKEQIILRRLPIGPFYEWMVAFGDRKVALLVALAAQRDIAWANTLSDESFALIALRSQTQNFHRAMAVAEIEPFIAAKILPLVELMEKGMAEAFSIGAQLTDLSQKQPSSGAAAETPKPSSASSTSINSSPSSSVPAGTNSSVDASKSSI